MALAIYKSRKWRHIAATGLPKQRQYKIVMSSEPLPSENPIMHVIIIVVLNVDKCDKLI